MTKMVDPMTGKIKYISLDGNTHDSKEEADKANAGLKKKGDASAKNR